MTASWSVRSASALGAMHVRSGLPNQDAVAWRPLGDDGELGIVVAVADGHGGARYVRSDTGSQLAVDVACDIASSWVATQPGRPMVELVQALPPAIVDRWRALVADHARAHPFTDAERARADEPLDDDVPISYGATVLVAVAIGDEVGLVQLGDGDIVVGGEDARVDAPMPDDPRLIGSQTTSLCLPTAVEDFRVAVVPAAARADFVLLASDGYGNSFADPGWHRQVVGDLRDQIDGHGLDQVGAELPGWLSESAAAAGDDVTVAILSRPTPAGAPTAPSPAGATTTPTSRSIRAARPSGSGRDRRAILPTLAIAAVAVVVGLGLGLLLGGGNDASPAPTAAGSTTLATNAGPGPSVTSTTLPTVGTAIPTTEVRIVGPKGGVIAFSPEIGGPPARIDGTAGTGSATTTLEVGDDTWTIAAGRLTVRAGTERPEPIVLDDLVPASLVYAGGFVWVIDADEAQLIAVDVIERRAIDESVRGIANGRTGDSPTAQGPSQN